MHYIGVVGGQFGDEGKGKITDYLARYARMVGRWAGGANAGHTIVKNRKKVVLHLVPSGCLYPGVFNIMGKAMVVNPLTLLEELAMLDAEGYRPHLRIAGQAHVILDYHVHFDAGLEAKLGAGRIGTTNRGIGPCCEAKANRKKALRVEDLLLPEKELEAKLEHITGLLCPELVEFHPWFRAFQGLQFSKVVRPDGRLKDALSGYAKYLANTCAAMGDLLKKHVEPDITKLTNMQIGGLFVGEGAQGTLLDPDHGTFPDVTSTTTVIGGMSTGLGIPPYKITDVLGVFKAYETRVGSGVFLTEEKGEIGERMRQNGLEFGATTGRPRRCGWFNLPEAVRAVRVNGMNWLAVTKLDVLDEFETIKFGVEEGKDGSVHYEELPGWKQSTKGCRTFEELPENAKSYLGEFKQLRCRLALVSVGEEEGETIVMPEFREHLQEHGIRLS